MIKSIRSLVALLGALVIGSTALAGDLLPAKAHFEGGFLQRQYLLDPTLPENFGKPFMHVISEGTGTISAGGRAIQRNDYLLRLVVKDGIVQIHGHGTWVDTTPSGDMIWGEFELYRPLDSLEAPFTYTVTGGSGRFVGSVGWGSGHSVMSADETSWETWSEGVRVKIKK